MFLNYKYSFSTLILSFSFLFSFSQPPNQIKNYKWGISFQLNTPQTKPDINYQQVLYTYILDDDIYGTAKGTTSIQNKSFSLGCMASYYLREDNFFRLRLGINKIDIVRTGDYEDTLNIEHREHSKKQTDLYLSPSMGWGITKNRLSLYAGFELPLILYGKTQAHYYVELFDKTSTTTQTSDITGTYSNGFSFGAGSFIGFSVKLNDRLSLGTELNMNFLYSKLGGDANYTVTDTGPYTGILTESYNYTITAYYFSKLKASLNINYLF